MKSCFLLDTGTQKKRFSAFKKSGFFAGYSYKNTDATVFGIGISFHHQYIQEYLQLYTAEVCKGY